MSWQDIVLTILTISFAIGLFPSILSNNKPALATSITNSVVSFVASFVNFTLTLYGATVGAFTIGVLWAILAVQKYMIDKKPVN